MDVTGCIPVSKQKCRSVRCKSDAQRKQGEILVNATTFRFDASDLMPGAIGAGAFWSEMTAFANGQDAKTTADNIQAAWDAIK